MLQTAKKNSSSLILLMSGIFWLVVVLICYSLVQNDMARDTVVAQQASPLGLIVQIVLVLWAVMRGIDILIFYLVKGGRKLFNVLNDWLGVSDQVLLDGVLASLPRYIYRRVMRK